uniref:thiol oxidase n=1 Tax=viral metagenome TaxID=1070528 RepID=A0A6C0D5B5_9ZZZZ
MKLPPSSWGPLYWSVIHITALAYPKNPTYSDKKAAKEFYESLQFILPCPICREHLKVHLTKFPITPHLDRREDLFKWTVNLHNEVNKSLNKPLFTEIEALSYIKRLGERKTSPMITHDMLNEIDMRSMIKGGFMGGAVVFTVGLCVYYFSNDK